MAIKTMQDLDNIDVANYEFSGEEIGLLLLESIKQAKAGQGVVRHTVSEAVQARHQVGLSQKEFAQLLGVSVRTLQAWEQGKRTPSKGAMTLLKIATKHPQALLSVMA